MLLRFRAPIRADLLSNYGVDLAEWVAMKRWDGLFDLIDNLPSASRYSEAYLNDPEIANAIANQPEPETRSTWAPPVSEFGTHGQMMVDLINAVKRLGATVIASQGGKPQSEKPYPTPVTELDRIRQAQEEAELKQDFARFGFEDFM